MVETITAVHPLVTIFFGLQAVLACFLIIVGFFSGIDALRTGRKLMIGEIIALSVCGAVLAVATAASVGLT